MADINIIFVNLKDMIRITLGIKSAIKTVIANAELNLSAFLDTSVDIKPTIVKKGASKVINLSRMAMIGGKGGDIAGKMLSESAERRSDLHNF